MDRHVFYEMVNGVAMAKGDVFAALRDLPVDVVAELMLEIPKEYSAARAILPRMAPDDVQDFWTGNHGHTLLFQSIAFVRAIETAFLRYLQRDLRNATILDYGCGWGRLLRLMYAFTAPENLYACDPWAKSLAMCRIDGIKANFAICDYLPKSIPFRDVKYDLIYAFSVFTHVSENTAKTILSAWRRSIKPNGLVALTFRPESYWWIHEVGGTKTDLDEMHRLHREGKYAFTPHNDNRGNGAGQIDADGLNTYGDSSFSLDYIRENWTEWDVAGTDVNLLDPYQSILFLKPRNAS